MENSDKQMEMLLEEGGIADDGASIDPVSGNDIPPGSMASEVRDDIPAQLSEGEYVVPADVLRFYGVKFFEDLRNEAKIGLANMEAEGRIGGEPVMDELPFADEELATLEGEDEPVQMNEGGMPGTQTTEFSTSAYQQDPSDPTQVIMGGSTKGYELITYYGPTGETVNIPFFNGMPLGLIPAGYTQSAPQDTAVERVAKESDSDTNAPTQVEETYRRIKTPEDFSNTDLRFQKAFLKGAGILFPIARAVISPQVKKLDEEIAKRKEAGLFDRQYDDLFDSEGLKGMMESDFSSPEKFKAALDYVAPKGMSWNTEEQTYQSDDGDPFAWMEDIGGIQQVETDDDVQVYEITDSDEFTSTGGVRPMERPSSISPSDEDEEE